MATATAIKERPILFSGEMVRAILGGRKTQTRRIVKPQPETYQGESGLQFELPGWHGSLGAERYANEYCTYGKPGDVLWCKETWADGGYRDPDWACCVAYKADNSGMNYLCKDGDEPVCLDTPCKLRPEGVSRWRPSIHMPRWASRITLEITDVRAERLQEISEADAIAEGIFSRPCSYDKRKLDWKLYGWLEKLDQWASDPLLSYQTLWQSINGPESWESNPWVWVVSFKRI